MSTVKKCDITGITDIPMIEVGRWAEVESLEDGYKVAMPSLKLVGERLRYGIIVQNTDGNAVKDVSEEFVLKELHQLTVERINEIHNESSPDPTSSAEVTTL